MSTDDELPFDPDTLDALASRIERVRRDCLCDIDGAGAEAVAEQHYLLALAALDEAQRHARLASIHQSRGLT
jgi:hypothetical protein